MSVYFVPVSSISSYLLRFDFLFQDLSVTLFKFQPVKTISLGVNPHVHSGAIHPFHALIQCG